MPMLAMILLTASTGMAFGLISDNSQSPNPGGSGIAFRHHFIDADLPSTHWAMLELSDLDGDGLSDVIVAQSRWARGTNRPARWYRNTGRIDTWDPPVVIATALRTDCGLTTADVDQDGDLDMLSGVEWSENPGDPAEGAPFERRPFDPEFHRDDRFSIHDLLAADLDGDGRDEIIASGDARNYDGLFVYKIPEDPRSAWTRTRIAEAGPVHAAIAPAGIGDIDGDGDPDIVYVDRWFENPGTFDRHWQGHVNLDFGRRGPWGTGARAYVVDMDGDGHNDIVQSHCDVDAARVVWFRNVAGDGSRWEEHVLPDTGTPGDFHSLVVADLDNDGDLDVYVDEMEHIHRPDREGDRRFGMIVWENRDGTGTSWTRQTVVHGLGGHEARAGDLDGDGDIDIVTKPYTAGPNSNDGRAHLSVLENLTVTD